jgi:excisionase family DNA binding protein
MIKNLNYLTSHEAARLLGFCPDHVRRLILQGKIKAVKLGHSWLIKPSDLKKVKRLRKQKEPKEHGND